MSKMKWVGVLVMVGVLVFYITLTPAQLQPLFNMLDQFDRLLFLVCTAGASIVGITIGFLHPPTGETVRLQLLRFAVRIVGAALVSAVAGLMVALFLVGSLLHTAQAASSAVLLAMFAGWAIHRLRS